MKLRSLVQRVDTWARSGPFTARDVSRYRIVYAVLVILALPDFTWVSGIPGTFYSPPPGPMALLDGPPALWAMIVLQAAIYILLVALAVGLFTRFSSIAVSVLMIFGYGLTFSYGKIDHTILMVVVPFIMAFSNWGAFYSLDSVRKPQIDPTTPQWPSRYLALFIGLAFFTAALPKVASGWLNPGTQSALGHFASRYVSGRDAPLTEIAGAIHEPWVWELVDWATILLEGGLIVCVIWWSWWRVAVAITTLFHLGVMLSFGIIFTANVIAYGAFVSWGIIALPRVSFALKKRYVWVVGALVPVVGVAVFAFESALPGVRDALLPGIVIAAAIGGVIYLVYFVRKLFRPTHVGDMQAVEKA